MRTRLPIKIKVAVVTAALTFVILSLFATVIGALAERRITDGFEDELRATAADLQDRLSVSRNDQGLFSIDQSDRDLLRGFASGGAVARVVDLNNRLVYATSSRELGPPIEGVTDAGDFRVISRQIVVPDVAREGTFDPLPLPVAREIGWVQYAETEASVQTTINRVRLFLAFGVLGGTALAFLGGLVVARRAMRPISGLTRAARQVARTRDPDVRLPKPLANDEVSELAYTLEDMLRELSAARGETEATLDRQRAFVADASHELRTPLTSILANLELLESDLGGEQREMAASALRSSRRMRRLVGGPAAPGTRGRRPRDRQVAGRPRRRGARGRARGGRAVGAPPRVGRRARPGRDRGRGRRPSPPGGNLVENALIHTPGGTPVTVSVRLEGDFAVLEVSDRGPGVPPAPCASGSSSASRAAAATRLRAAAAASASPSSARWPRRTAAASSVADAEGGGARFTVRLPAAARSDSAASVLTPEEPDPGFLKEPHS